MAAVLLLAAAAAYSQDVQKLDPSLDKFIAADAKLERVATGFNKWTEGPVLDAGRQSAVRGNSFQKY